jgi:hypothetical protein
MSSALLSGHFFPLLARLGKCNGDRLFAAFHLAALAVAPALGATAFVAVHLATDFLALPEWSCSLLMVLTLALLILPGTYHRIVGTSRGQKNHQ